mgnify:FL=1
MNASEKAAANRAARGIVPPRIVPKPKPDFAALRAERDAAIEKVIQSVCDKQGWDRSKVTAHISGAHGCYCACPDGPCEHEFSGWQEFDDGLGGEQVCKLCGMGAMAHTLRYAP